MQRQASEVTPATSETYAPTNAKLHQPSNHPKRTHPKTLGSKLHPATPRVYSESRHGPSKQPIKLVRLNRVNKVNFENHTGNSDMEACSIKGRHSWEFASQAHILISVYSTAIQAGGKLKSHNDTASWWKQSMRNHQRFPFYAIAERHQESRICNPFPVSCCPGHFWVTPI